jgi:poly-gamma-glutamate synthase PgsB/CapB
MTWQQVIRSHLPRVARRAGAHTIALLAARLDALAQDRETEEDLPEVALARLLPVLTGELLRVEPVVDELNESLALARTQGNERAALVEVLTRIDEPGLDQDLLALDRHLDSEGVQDRLLLHLHAARQQWEFLALALASCSQDPLSDDHVIACRDAAAQVLVGTRRPWPLRVAACRLAGALCLRALPGAPSVRQTLLALAHAERDDPWVQAAALEAWLAVQTDSAHKVRVLRGIAAPTAERRTLLPPEHAFVRARAARLAGHHQLWDLLRQLLGAGDESEHVECAVARTLARSPRQQDRGALVALMSDARARPTVRGSAVVASLPDAPPEPAETHWIRLVQAALQWSDAEVAGLVIRAVLDRVAHLVPQLERCRDQWRPALEQWRRADEAPDLSVAASTLLLTLEILTDPHRRAALEEIQDWANATSEGAARNFRSGRVADLAPDQLLDVLAVAAADGMDLSAEPRGGGLHGDQPPRRGYRLHHGTAPGVRLWRLLYEVRRPRPDKRQAHSFATDRVPPGSLVALSNRLAEVTPTAVPGQRQGAPTRLAWGAELPLPSLLLAASRRKGIRVRTSTTAFDLQPRRPALLARAAAHRHYTRLADLRQRLLDGGADDPQGTYDEALSRIGFGIDRRAAAFLPLFHLDDLVRHLVALDSNSVPQLALLSGGLVAYWVGRSLFRRRQETRWRGRIPLVIGGWGSRGKSGTERLKAAVFHGTGYTVLSKTTGCEAMVVASIPGREPTEIFLYRPYDKATIFEQRSVLRLARAMEPQVLLWECMALNPYYVQILQQDWVRDDFTTITNTYPDHEDIQGPTGRDVADVISQIIPWRGAVVTSEQHMTPVVTQTARERRATVDVVRPEEWLLLPKDLLARFPYNEHPRNIALVVHLAEKLEIPRDVALRAMADHVVPDLGVLKEYGPVEYDGRTASFVNGMSANERAGFLSNWARMGFGTFSDRSGLEEFTAVVVNNRADRLARQDVFARIAALDVAADALVVIGTNVQSFHGTWLKVLNTELRDRLRDLAATSRERLVQEMGRRLRRKPLSAAEARERAVAAGADAAAVDGWVAAFWDPAQSPDAVSRSLVLHSVAARGSGERTLTDAAHQWLRETSWLHFLEHREDWSIEEAISGFIALFGSRGLPLANPALSGDQVLHAVAMTAPPGAQLRVLGSCNIKGTGLDFVYRWLSIQKVLGWAEVLRDPTADQCRDIVRAMGTHPTYGVADTRVAVATLEEQLAGGRLQAWGLEEEATRTAARLRSLLPEKERGLEAAAQLTVPQQARRWLRAAVDFWDSIARTREAEALYVDLAARRVGQEGAAKVAKAIVYRQKI